MGESLRLTRNGSATEWYGTLPVTGVGEAFHSGSDSSPTTIAAPSYNTVLEPGMVFTIEPMLTLGTIEWEQWDNGWTVVTKDRSRTAQFEHTVVVTEYGAEILTLPSKE